MCLNQVELNQVVRAKFKKYENFSKKIYQFYLFYIFWHLLFCLSQQLNYSSSQYCILIKNFFNKLNLTFLFISFCSEIENIERKIYFHGFLRTNVLNSRTMYLNIFLCVPIWYLILCLFIWESTIYLLLRKCNALKG